MQTEAMETGKLCWFDFGTQDDKRAMSFYKSLLGWQFEAMGPDYWAIKVSGETIGGLRKETTKEFTPAAGFYSYFTVPSIKEANGLVSKNGGQLVGKTVAIGENGYYQLFKDLDGNTLSLWSKKP